MKILVTGGTGMVGKALQKVCPTAIFLSSEDADLRDFNQAQAIIAQHEPDQIIHLAARVGGIKANMDNLGDFYRENILINTNVLESARRCNVQKVLSLLSTCIYPDKVTYPLTEEQIHDGPPHPSNYAYAYAKRMLDIQSRAYRKQYGCNFITAVPNNLFGEHDNYDLDDSHVIPAIIHKVYRALHCEEDIFLWGDGTPKREFTYSVDLANILLFLLEHYDEAGPINIGNTGEYSILEVVEIITAHLDFQKKISWDTNKPTGQYRKPSNNHKLLELGWRPENYTNFKTALHDSCDWFVENYPHVRGVK
jgi:GDP-L-fucose synthase